MYSLVLLKHLKDLGKYIELPNLYFKGFVSEEEKRMLLDICWMLVLPILKAFIQAYLYMKRWKAA